MKKIIAFLLCTLLVFGAAFAMTEDEARSILLKSVDSAASAKNIAIYPSRTDNAAFAVVTEKWNKNTSVYASYWFVTRKETVRLGKGDNNWSWGIAYTVPEVFFNSYGAKDNRHSRAVALIDGKPVEIENAKRVRSFVNDYRSVLSCLTDVPDGDRAFLRLILDDPQHPTLAQIHGRKLTRKEFFAFDGAKAALETIEEAGYTATECFCWDRKAFGLNLSRGSEKYHTYVFMVDGSIELMGGWWGDEIGLEDGSVASVYDLELPIVESK